MATNKYVINKGVNQSMVFKGLKAQYIWYMGAAMFGLLILYAVMYMAGANTYISLAVTAVLGGAALLWIYHLSSTYGEHGLVKALAKRSIPRVIKSNSRKVFIRRSLPKVSKE